MQIRAYQKGELAQMYYPWCGKRQALSNFNRDVQRSWALCRGLRRMGWRPANRIFTERQSELIFKILGEP